MNQLHARPPYGQPINWTNTIFFALTPVVGIAGIWLYARSYGIAAGDLIGFGIMMLLSSIAVIPGYHRYFAHRTYSASRPLEAFYLIAAPVSFHPAAHVYGRQPYTSDETARDSWWLDFFTFGEGHHNFHHAFPGDYRIGHKPWHFDPAKWWIASMAFFGLASRLHRTPEERISAHADVPARDPVRRHDELPQLHVAG